MASSNNPNFITTHTLVETSGVTRFMWMKTIQNDLDLRKLIRSEAGLEPTTLEDVGNYALVQVCAEINDNSISTPGLCRKWAR